MPRYVHPPMPKSPELQQAEQDAAEMLYAYFRRDYGVQARVSRDTGLNAAALSNMGKGRYPISLEHAMLIETASNGELQAEKLCPSGAAVLGSFLRTRFPHLAA